MKAELELIKPDKSFCDEISAYRNAFFKSGGSMDGTGKLNILENPLEWIDFNKKPENCEKEYDGWMKSIQYACVRKSDRKIVGMIQLRLLTNDFLNNFGGYIGYSVHPDERRKGYAKWMLKKVLEKARESGMKKVLVTCYEKNEGSRKTILSQGGKYETTVFCPQENRKLQRYWIET